MPSQLVWLHALFLVFIMNARIFLFRVIFFSLLFFGINTLRASSYNILTPIAIDLNLVKKNKSALWLESTSSLQAYTVSSDLLSTLIDSDSVSIPIPEGGFAEASFVRLDRVGESVIWIGSSLDGSLTDTFLLPVNNTLIGQFQHNGRRYELEPFVLSEGGQQRTLILVRGTYSPSQSNQQLDVKKRSANVINDLHLNHQAMIPADAELRLLSIYTGDARRESQGRKNIEAKINLSISQTNKALERAGVTHRIHLTAHIEMENEARFLEHLSSRRSFKRELHSADIRRYRELHQADVVSIVISDWGANFNSGGGSCGIAGYILQRDQTLTEIFDNAGFISVASCLSNYTFSHEIGHIFGLAHPRDSQSAYREFGVGFKSNTLSTLMRSTPYCNSALPPIQFPDYCNKVLWYSSATSTTPQGEALGDTDHDSALLLKETTPVIASLYERLPHFVVHPKNIRLIPGRTITLQSRAEGVGDLTYEWFKDGVSLDSSGSLHQIENASDGDSGQYFVRVSNLHGSSDSAIASIGNPVFVKQPVFITVKLGKAFRLTAIAKGKGTLTYQWYKDDQPLNDESSHKYFVKSAARDDEGLYYVTATNDSGNSVKSVVVKVDVTRHPPDILKPNGGSFKVTLGSDLRLITFFLAPEPSHKYQWFKDGVAIEQYGNRRIYQITNASEEDAGIYTLEVRESFTNTKDTSSPFVVTVTNPANP